MKPGDRVYSPWSWTAAQLEQYAAAIGGCSPIDLGIVRAVKTMADNGVETFESCQGGDGHCFPEPTVRFHGQPAAGWHALSVCLEFGFPVLSLRRYWSVSGDGEPEGPEWEITFRRQLSLAAGEAAP